LQWPQLDVIASGVYYSFMAQPAANLTSHQGVCLHDEQTLLSISWDSGKGVEDWNYLEKPATITQPKTTCQFIPGCSISWKATKVEPHRRVDE